MIIGIGCDIVEHALTEKLNWLTDIQVQKRIFSHQELELYSKNKTVKFLAGRFAAKEAILKSLGTGMEDGLLLTSIQILQAKDGKPTVALDGEVKKISDLMLINSWHVSISHTTNYSYASVVAERLFNVPAVSH